jgi:hypothetical protein
LVKHFRGCWIFVSHQESKSRIGGESWTFIAADFIKRLQASINASWLGVGDLLSWQVTNPISHDG